MATPNLAECRPHPYSSRVSSAARAPAVLTGSWVTYDKKILQAASREVADMESLKHFSPESLKHGGSRFEGDTRLKWLQEGTGNWPPPNRHRFLHDPGVLQQGSTAAIYRIASLIGRSPVLPLSRVRSHRTVIASPTSFLRRCRSKIYTLRRRRTKLSSYSLRNLECFLR